jgi:hypothetical protein
VNSSTTHEEWKALSADQRRELIQRWDAYLGEGADVVEGVANELRQQLKDNPNVEDVLAGVDHGGTWTIAVFFRKNQGRQFPQMYQGFPTKIVAPAADMRPTR